MFMLGAIVSTCYVPGVTGAFVATQWPVLSILLPLCLWRSGPMTSLHWLGLLFIAFAIVRLQHTPIFDDGVWGLWLLCIMGGNFWLGSTTDSLRKLYAGLAVGASISSILAIFQAFGYADIPYVQPAPAGLYVNRVVQGMVLAFVAVALVSERMWLWLPLLLPGLVLSGSRGAWIALAAGLASMYVRRVWLLAFVGIACAIFLARLSPSDAMRLFIWDATVHNLTWFGWGPGSFFSWALWYQGSNTYPEYAHNDALQLVFEYGVAAVLPIGIFVFALTRTQEREWPVIVTFAVAGCYSMPLWAPVPSFLACVVAGRIVRSWALARRDRDHSGQPVISWRRYAGRTGCGAISLEPHHQAEGA